MIKQEQIEKMITDICKKKSKYSVYPNEALERLKIEFYEQLNETMIQISKILNEEIAKLQAIIES